MFSSLRRCRTGTFILAGTLLASGLLARDVRGLRTPDTNFRGVITTPGLPVAIGDETISVQLQLETLYTRLKAMGQNPQGLLEPFEAFKQGLNDGSIDDAAIWACVASMSDPQVQAKADFVMRDFAQRVLAGQLGFDLADFPLHDRPMAWRELPETVPGGLNARLPMAPLACGTCAAPGGTLAAPTLACQFQSGNTNACGTPFREVYNVTLTAGTSYTFTMCTATCPGATANYDSRIIVWNPTCVTQLANNDDSCGLLSEATVTPTVSGVHKVEVTGFTSSNSGTYTMGYRQNPPSTCGTCAAPLNTITPTPVCQTVTGSNTSCPFTGGTGTSPNGGVWYNVNLTAGRNYTFSTCPNNAAGGACFGTASFDTRLDLWNNACTTRLAGNDDLPGCSLIFRSAFLYNPPTTGVYKLQVRGFTADVGTYTLAYQEQAGCVAPSIATNTPTSGTITGTNCSLTQTFTVGLSALSSGPFTGSTWTIAAPVGATATPASGTMTFTGTTGRFTSTLTRPACGTANFTVAVVIRQTCSANTATRTWTYQLRDGRAPTVVGCPASTTLDCAAPDPPAPTLTATDNCDPAPTITFAQTRVNGNCPGNFTTRRTWTARDCSNNSGICTQNLTHRDTTPPTISGSDAWCMYPPNHEYYCIGAAELTPTLADNCSLPVSLALTGCLSNEPDEGTGDGDFPNDCIISPDGKTVCLRVERAGSGSDRVYAILGIAIDACGNRSAPQPIALATVPHDDSEHPECRQANGGLDKHF